MVDFLGGDREAIQHELGGSGINYRQSPYSGEESADLIDYGFGGSSSTEVSPFGDAFDYSELAGGHILDGEGAFLSDVTRRADEEPAADDEQPHDLPSQLWK